jgi:4-hydroxybenzoate polyprenyltransferase/phosphoserine phosphatase
VSKQSGMAGGVMATTRPLVVDLDGTLLRTDTLLELMLAFIRMRWVNVFVLFGLLAGDRATLKAELARRTAIDVSLLPVRQEVVDLISDARSSGRPVVLATASDQAVAGAISEDVVSFDEVFASTPGNNLKGHKKAEALVERFGDKGFDYVGNDTPDLVVFHKAHTAYVVETSASLLRRATAANPSLETLGHAPHQLGPLIRSLRPHQWVKNLLIFLPALAAQSLAFDNALPLLIAFVLFSAMASAVYVTNDLLDLQSDRAHPTKKNRPFASGVLPIPVGLALSPLLGVGALAGAWFLLGPAFTAVLAAYAVITLAYSVWLKRVVLVDVFTLSALYGIRLVAGAVAFEIPISPWLAAFATFAFLSLALVKRFVEMSENNQSEGVLPGRGYLTTDAPLIALFGVVSGFVGGVVLALYVEDPDTVEAYANPLVMWGAVPVWLFWITRTWFLAHRKKLKDDPVLFAVTDWPSYVAGALIAAAFILAR